MESTLNVQRANNFYCLQQANGRNCCKKTGNRGGHQAEECAQHQVEELQREAK